MTGYDFLAYGVSAVAIAVAAGAIIPNPFRQNIRDTLSILTFGLLNSVTTEEQRAEAEVKRLTKELAENERKASDIRGTVNHHKNNVLTRLKAELKQAEDDYQLAVQQKLGADVENDCVDRIGASETAVREEEVTIEDLQKTADAVRLAIAKAAKEVKALARKVDSKLVKSAATKIMDSASKILHDTKDVGAATSEIGKDLDKIDEKYEQAKARFEDSQGSDAQRKLEEARAGKNREDILKRMEERRKAAEGAGSK